MITTTSNQRDGAMNFRRFAGVALVLATLFLAGCVSISTDGDSGGGMTEETQKHRFDVGENPTIDVRGFNGAIVIVTGRDGVVDVEANFKIPSRISYSATVSENIVTVVAKRVGTGITIGRSPKAEIHMVIPSHSVIKARTSNGRIDIDGVTGTGEVETSNGTITIKNVSGAFSSSTSNGSVYMSNVTGEFDAKTSNGKIEYSGAFTSGGDNDFTTSNGSIDITLSEEPSLELVARTSNGTVNSGRPILATVTERTHLEGKYGDGAASLELRTSNGSIRIR